MFILIDNYDSFTYNLVHFLGELGAEVDVVRNDKITPMEVMARRPEGVILSPGPCTPDDAGICLDMVTVAAQTRLPLLGVCLGHQSIGQALGGLVVRETPRHGKMSDIRHRGKGLFKGLPDMVRATRYHSLVVERESLPSHFEVTAETEDRLIMGMNHRELPIHGLQFHPESIETQYGHDMLKNFLDAARAANNQIEWPAAAA
jgi:anthranilate synthase component II